MVWIHLIYIISKSLRVIFIIVTLLLSHISIGFWFIRSIAVHFDSFKFISVYEVHCGPFVLFHHMSIHLVYFSLFGPLQFIRSIHSTLIHLVYLVHFGPFVPLQYFQFISLHFSDAL